MLPDYASVNVAELIAPTITELIAQLTRREG
jgi:hypothetical protein